MAEAGTHQGWKYRMQLREVDGRLSAYTIHFYREDGNWFDEIRYDSHDGRHGRKEIAPHFHMKVRSPFKNDSAEAVEEIKFLIDNEIDRLRKVIGR